MVKVSVIIPVYNVCNYLRKCVASVENQSYADREVILVDDGSTDGSNILCDQLADDYSDVCVIHKENGGLSSARNAGLRKATGSYVIFLDSDDLWIGEDSLECLCNIATEHDADIVRGEYLTIDEEGKRTFTEHNVDNKPCNVLLSSKEMFTKAVNGEYFSWLFLFKAGVIKDLLFNESQLFQEDIDFAIKLFCKQLKCVYTPLRFYAYRKRAGSLITTSNIRQLKYSFILADTFNVFAPKARATGLETEYLYNSVMMYYLTLCTLASDQYHTDRLSIIQELNLDELQKRTAQRAIAHKIINKHLPVILSSPKMGIRAIRAKLSVYSLIKHIFA